MKGGAPGPRRLALPDQVAQRRLGVHVAPLGAKDCTPEIDTSEIIVDFQWHFPMDFEWHFQTEFHIPVVFSKGLSHVQWSFTGNVPWMFNGIFQRNFTSVISGV